MQLILNTYTEGSYRIAHIPDADGKPICRVELPDSIWQVVDVEQDRPNICPSCQRISVRRRAAIAQELAMN